MPPMSGTSAVPIRPGPTTLQSAATNSSFNPDSGSSGGVRTSGSFILLPPGAQLPNPPPQVVFPSSSITNKPSQKRLSRPISQKPLPSIPSSPPVPDEKPTVSPAPPTSWSVHFRGFVKAVKWSRSNPSLNKSARKDKSREPGVPPTSKEGQDAKDAPTADAKPSMRRFVSSNSFSSLGRKGTLPARVSPNVGGVFLVPHGQVNTQHEFRPPTPGWMYPVPVDPHELATVRTVIGHSSEGSRQSLDGFFPAPISPPRADTSLRKSMSEIGHGSVMYAPISPEASVSSFEHLPHFPVDSADPSREFIPRQPTLPDTELVSSIPPPLPPKKPFSFKRALSFKRAAEHKSTSDIPSDLNGFPLPSHRPSKSVDAPRPALAIVTTAVDENGRKRLRRRSTLADHPRSSSDSPTTRRGRDRPQFMLSPDASESSILSISATIAHSPSPDTGMAPSAASSRRRLTKRRPSEKTKSSLPTTVEVDTPGLEIADPIASLAVLPPFTPQVPALPTPNTPGLPLSAPPTTGLRMHGITSVLPATETNPRVSSSPSSMPLPPVPPLPPLPQLPTPSTSSSPYAIYTPSHTNTKGAAPPTAMRLLRPAMPQRPSLERRASRRRWTLDLASEDIDETVLKAELERLRLLGEPSSNNELSNMDPNWTLARKVLLSCREVILTERSYLNQITRFMADSAEDAGTPPLLVKHLPLLISASQAFCNRLVEDPSAWGVSAAFVTVEAVLEQVLVDYCQVVGQIMLACQQQSASQKSPSSSHSRFPSMSKSRTSIANGANEFGKIFVPSSKSSEKIAADDRDKHAPVAWHGLDESPSGSFSRGVPRTRSMPGKSSKSRRVSLPAASNASSTSIGSNAPPIPNYAGGSSTQLSITPGPSPTDKRPNGNLATGKARAITAADIAIAPPQRVTRYVMLYRDLLNGTPLTAPSRPLVQRALDGALRIAENCNRAQNFMTRKP